MRYARLFVPYRGYWDIRVDVNSIEGGYHGYQYNCIVLGSGAEINLWTNKAYQHGMVYHLCKI